MESLKEMYMPVRVVDVGFGNLDPAKVLPPGDLVLAPWGLGYEGPDPAVPPEGPWFLVVFEPRVDDHEPQRPGGGHHAAARRWFPLLRTQHLARVLLNVRLQQCRSPLLRPRRSCRPK